MKKNGVEIISVNISTEKGTIKKAVDSARIDYSGVEGDAHAGDWHRQISLLGNESFKRFEEKAGRKINFGEFAENLTTEGIELVDTQPGDRFANDNIELQVTQIGKKCHGSSCAIYNEVGSCVMPKEGIFCRVIRPGKISKGDFLEYIPKTYRIRLITLSDRASKGIYPDKSGPEIQKRLKEFFGGIKWKYEIDYHLIPDDKDLFDALIKDALDKDYDMLISTGGTGIGPRDFAPDVIKPYLQKEIPGIMDMIRMKYGLEKPAVLSSRAIAGVNNNTLLFTLPGSVKAVNEYMEEIEKGLVHLIFMLYGINKH